MTTETKQLLIRYSILTVLIGGIFLILYFFASLSFSLRANTLKSSAENVIKNSSLAQKYTSLKISKLNKPYQVGNLQHAVLSAQFENKDVSLYFITLSGKFGMYQGLFLVIPQEDVYFCGLAGNIDLTKDPDFYGITDTSIGFWRNKLRTFL